MSLSPPSTLTPTGCLLNITSVRFTTHTAFSQFISTFQVKINQTARSTGCPLSSMIIYNRKKMSSARATASVSGRLKNLDTTHTYTISELYSLRKLAFFSWCLLAMMMMMMAALNCGFNWAQTSSLQTLISAVWQCHELWSWWPIWMETCPFSPK